VLSIRRFSEFCRGCVNDTSVSFDVGAPSGWPSTPCPNATANQADLGTKWEQDWEYQPNAATMYVCQGRIVTASRSKHLSITAKCFQYQEFGRRTGLKIRCLPTAAWFTPTGVGFVCCRFVDASAVLRSPVRFFLSVFRCFLHNRRAPAPTGCGTLLVSVSRLRSARPLLELFGDGSAQAFGFENLRAGAEAQDPALDLDGRGQVETGDQAAVDMV
jgi:hypothetical protein